MKKLSLAAFIIILAVCITCRLSDSNREETVEPNPFFAEFSKYRGYGAKFRAGAEIDTLNFHIKALTTAFFDSTRYTPQTTYIIKHQVSGDSLVINTNDAPLLSHLEFSEFYRNNKDKNKADTILSPSFFEKFCIESTGKVNVESFQHLPFVFMDVSFKGYPALLVRQNVDDRYLCRYRVYGIRKDGFHLVDFEPYLSIKNSVNSWCSGGSTEFDYDKKTITVRSLSPDSCSDYGTFIIQIYTLNPDTDRFVLNQIENEYDFG